MYAAFSGNVSLPIIKPPDLILFNIYSAVFSICISIFNVFFSSCSGLFEPSHMHFAFRRQNDTAGEPSLTEMTEKAIQILSNDPDGFVLVVECKLREHKYVYLNDESQKIIW